MTSQSNCDEYGFCRPDGFNRQQQEDFMKSYIRVLATRRKKWDKGIIKKGTDPSTPPQLGRKLKGYIRKGVPGPYRAQIWMEVSGAGAARSSEPDLYSNMLAMNTNMVTEDQIRTDISRTFPNNIHFDSTNPVSLQTSLYKVLKAFANSNPTIGYCQGLNYITGLLLLITKDEESSFWLLKTLVDKILPEYYSVNMPGLITDSRVLAELARKNIPQISNHIDALQVPWALLSSKWFICLFVDVLPVETVLRIWDCLFAEGSKFYSAYHWQSCTWTRRSCWPPGTWAHSWRRSRDSCRASRP
eukprot:TRINITY_DN20539_c0_g1_i4.p1 TRINITY_DN20539_c0_g1~~TRINITY_DN20539_c0_g1_i4.p1  ORF type:complete len:301 (+),score=32.21 TRINITY_DN20539_c0_g1_i4:53-955(+)